MVKVQSVNPSTGELIKEFSSAAAGFREIR